MGHKKYDKPFENLKPEQSLTKLVLVVQLSPHLKFKKLNILNSVYRMAMKHHPAHVPTRLRSLNLEKALWLDFQLLVLEIAFFSQDLKKNFNTYKKIQNYFFLIWLKTTNLLNFCRILFCFEIGFEVSYLILMSA